MGGKTPNYILIGGATKLRVLMNTTTNFEGLKLVGHEYDVPNYVATRWVKARIASIAPEFVPGVNTTIDEQATLPLQVDISPEPVIDTEPEVQSQTDVEIVQDGQEEVGDDTSDAILAKGYSNMGPKDLYAERKRLYAECKSRGLQVEAKKPAEYYIELLMTSDKEAK